MLTDLKRRMSTLKVDSWPMLLFEFGTFGKGRHPKKACTYWWLVVPSSLPLAGLVGLLYVVMGLMVACFAVAWSFAPVIVWLFGYKPRHWTLISQVKDEENDSAIIQREYGGTIGPPIKQRVTPLYVIVPVAVLVLAVVYNQTVGDAAALITNHWKYVALAVAGIALLVAIGAAFKYVIAPMFRRICPDITWVNDKQDAASS